MLAALLRVSDGFRFAMQAAVANSEDCTLSGCLYLDEAEPGNPLAPDNATKTWNFYVSFLEFPQYLLLMEEGWLCIASIRTNEVKKVNGHIAGVAKHLLNYLVFELGTHKGIQLQLEDESYSSATIVRIRWVDTVGDEAAMSHLWNSRSASANLPCMKCTNVTVASSGWVDLDPSGACVDISCPYTSRFFRRSHQDACRMHDRLEALNGTMSATAFVDEQKACGMTYNAHGLLSDKRLREHLDYDGSRYDSQHTTTSNGTIAKDMWAF